ncbi:hypothetical protein FRB95_010263 [Tulasnella sp. JGI-2019a]|nr:hypothetical protein FRB95_010263 [Tulasnella sp. JGI-2019a]
MARAMLAVYITSIVFAVLHATSSFATPIPWKPSGALGRFIYTDRPPSLTLEETPNAARQAIEGAGTGLPTKKQVENMVKVIRFNSKGANRVALEQHLQMVKEIGDTTNPHRENEEFKVLWAETKALLDSQKVVSTRAKVAGGALAVTAAAGIAAGGYEGAKS